MDSLSGLHRAPVTLDMLYDASTAQFAGKAKASASKSYCCSSCFVFACFTYSFFSATPYRQAPDMISGSARRASKLLLPLQGHISGSSSWPCSTGSTLSPQRAFSSSSSIDGASEHVQAAAAAFGGGLGSPLPAMERTGCVYLDYNATTPVWPEVRSVAWVPCDARR